MDARDLMGAIFKIGEDSYEVIDVEKSHCENKNCDCILANVDDKRDYFESMTGILVRAMRDNIKFGWTFRKQFLDCTKLVLPF